MFHLKLSLKNGWTLAIIPTDSVNLLMFLLACMLEVVGGGVLVTVLTKMPTIDSLSAGTPIFKSINRQQWKKI